MRTLWPCKSRATFKPLNDDELFFFSQLIYSKTAIPVYSIIAIELTLKWNHISDVYEVASTGQIIPLITRAAALVTVLWKLTEDLVVSPITEQRAHTHTAQLDNAAFEGQSHVSGSYTSNQPQTDQESPSTPNANISTQITTAKTV